MRCALIWLTRATRVRGGGPAGLSRAARGCVGGPRSADRCVPSVLLQALLTGPPLMLPVKTLSYLAPSREPLNVQALILRAIAVLLSLFSAQLCAQTTTPAELRQVLTRLSERAASIEQVSYTYVGISLRDGEPDTTRAECAIRKNPKNGMGMNSKFYVPRFNTGISLHEHSLTFFDYADSTYTQREVEEDGSQAFSGSVLEFFVNRLPFHPDMMTGALFHSPIIEYAIDTSGETVQIQVAYADTEFLQDNHATYRFDRSTGFFASSISTYTDGINEYRRVIAYENPRFNEEFRDMTAVPSLPDTTAWSLNVPPQQRPDLAVGDTLPEFDRIVESLELPTTSYRLYLVDTWYFSCAPCQKLSPLIEELYQQKREGLAVFGLNLFDDPETITRYQEMKDITFPSYAGRDGREAYAINAFPKVYLLDRQGRILHVTDGYEPDFLERIEPAIQANMK